MKNDKSDIIDRIARNAKRGGQSVEENVEFAKGGVDTANRKFPKYRMSPSYIEFACGCLCKRNRKLRNLQTYDPVIFRQTRQQAFYERVCDFHAPSMGTFLSFGGLKDLSSWKAVRAKEIGAE